MAVDCVLVYIDGILGDSENRSAEVYLSRQKFW